VWRERHPDYDREDRLRRRLIDPDRAGASAAARVEPLAGVDWSAARAAVGLEVSVVVEEIGRVVVGWARDAVLAQASRIAKESAKVGVGGARDAIGAGGPAP
jgi:hypothetical protein